MKHVQNPKGLIRAQNRVADFIGPVIPAGGGFDAMWTNPIVFQKTYPYADDATPMMLTVEEKALFGPIGYESTTVCRDQFAPQKLLQYMANECRRNIVQLVLFTYGTTVIIIHYHVFDSEILSNGNYWVKITPKILEAIPSHKKIERNDCPAFIEKLRGITG